MFASKVDRAVTAGLIVQDNESCTPESEKNQLKTVQDIVNLVAKDSPTDGVRRMVKMVRNICSRARSRGESAALFSRRFQSLALEYLHHCEGIVAEQDSQNFAMILLENSRLPPSVYSTVATQLLSSTTTRGNLDDQKIYVASKNAIEVILQKICRAESHLSRESLTNDDENDYQALCSQELSSIKSPVKYIAKQNEIHDREDRKSFRVTLDDAVEALADVITDDLDRNLDSRTKSTIMGKRRHPEDSILSRLGSDPKNRRIKNYCNGGRDPKVGSSCLACGKKGHWRWDDECIFNIIQNVAKGRQIDQRMI